MNSNRGYLGRAWRDLTQDPRWWQPVLILSLVNLIPIVGSLITTGYLIDWAREGAWGMDRAFTRKVGDAGKRLKWGFFAVIISICWVVPISIVGELFAVIPVIGWLIAVVANVCVLIAGVIASAASVRMSIYDRFGAGLQISRMMNMAKRDAGGLARCFFISLLKVIPVVVGCVIIFIAFAPLLAGLSFTGSDLYSADITLGFATAIMGGGLFAMLVTFVIMFVMMVAVTACDALAWRSFGYWTAQFEPAKWNGMNDPMPFEPGYTARSTYEASNSASKSGSDNATTDFTEAKEQVAAAASAVGAAAAAAASKAADKAAEVAEGFKTEKVDPAEETNNDPIVVEAEVTDNEAATSTEPAETADATADAGDATDAGEQSYGERLAAIYRESYEKHHGTTGNEGDEPLTCPNCGNPVEPSNKFCTECGTRLQ